MERILVTLDEGAYTVANGARTITLTGLSTTVEIEHLAYVYNITQKVLYYNPSGNKAESLALCSIASNVITIDSDFDTLTTGDKVHIQIFVAADTIDPRTMTVVNPNYAHYTSVESITESNLGIDAVYDGGGTQDTVMTDSGNTYTAETVAEGYTIYNVTQATSALIAVDSLIGYAGDGGAGDPTADDITHAALGADWVDDDVASIPECKRHVLPTEGFNLNGSTVILDSQDANNSCYAKFYGTHNSDADATSTQYWEDLTSEYYGVATITADGIGDATRTVTQAVAIVDTPQTWLKYMVEFVGVCSNGTQDSEFKFLWKKSS